MLGLLRDLKGFLVRWTEIKSPKLVLLPNPVFHASMNALSFVLVLSLCAICKCLNTGEKIYVYDWPELVNRYANFTDRDHTSHGVEVPVWRTNYGAGRLVEGTNLEHKTSQFALHKIFYERALIDPRRTLNPAEATTFFIPFDIGMHIAFLESNGRMRRSGCPLAEQVERRLSELPYFKRNGGHDHLLVFAVNYNMNYFMNAPKCQHFLRMCWNCTKLSIDEYLFTAKHRMFEAKNRGINWHAVPFPSDYHYSRLAARLSAASTSASQGALSSSGHHRQLSAGTGTGSGSAAHEKHKKGVGGHHKHHKDEMDMRLDRDSRKHSVSEAGKAIEENVADIISASGGTWSPPWDRIVPAGHDGKHLYTRNTIVSFTGSPRRFNEYSTMMRESLVRMCGDLNNTAHCSYGHYKHDLKVSNNELSRRSVFCLQPPGDMPSRKSVFDAILSGCIPVLFHPLTAKYMYEWHWGQSLWEDIAISFDSSEENRHLIDGTDDFISRLVTMYNDKESVGYEDGGNSRLVDKANTRRVAHVLKGGRKEVRRRQLAMAKVAYQLQYSLIESNFNDGGKLEVASRSADGTPNEDAYDVAMRHVLAIHAGKEKHDRTSDFVQCSLLAGPQELQTADWCNSTNSLLDPYKPSAYDNALYV